MIVIIAILMAIAIPAYLSQQKKAKDTKSKSYINIAYRDARSEALDNSGLYPTPAALATAIQASDPELSVAAGSCYGALTDQVVIDTTSTPTNLIICSKSGSATLWKSTATLTALSTPASITAAKIFYESDSTGNGQIWSMNPDGSNKLRMANTPGFTEDPSVDSQQAKMAYTANSGGSWNIFVANTDGTNQTQLVTDAGTDVQPSISKDGAKIAFMSTRDGDNEIFIVSTSGGAETQLTTNAFVDSTPNFGSDGKIYFQTNRDGNYEIYRMNADGTNPVNLTNSAGTSDQQPSLSADGTKILFSRNGSNIWMMNADGSNQVQVTTGNNGDTFPSWSPDNTQIAFDRTGVWTANIDGSGAAQRANVGTDVYPSWGS